jgi:hypothetical protein
MNFILPKSKSEYARGSVTKRCIRGICHQAIFINFQRWCKILTSSDFKMTAWWQVVMWQLVTQPWTSINGEQKSLSLDTINASNVAQTMWKSNRTAVLLNTNCSYDSRKQANQNTCIENLFSDQPSHVVYPISKSSLTFVSSVITPQATLSPMDHISYTWHLILPAQNSIFLFK